MNVSELKFLIDVGVGKGIENYLREKGYEKRGQIYFFHIDNAKIRPVAMKNKSVPFSPILPTDVIAIRAAAGSSDPAGILPTTLFATLFSTIIAIFAAKLYGKLPFFRRTRPVKSEHSEDLGEDKVADSLWLSWRFVLFFMGDDIVWYETKAASRSLKF